MTGRKGVMIVAGALVLAACGGTDEADQAGDFGAAVAEPTEASSG